MSRHIIKQEPRSPRFENFVAELVREFNQPAQGASRQPVIVEQHVPSTGSRHLHVIWDEWRRIPELERSEIIVDAYRQAEGDAAANEVTIAVGATVAEALALGLLPYRVVPAPKTNGVAAADTYRRALDIEATRSLVGAGSTELRYATLDGAVEAVERLQKEFEGSKWIVIQEVGVEN